jgi:hypothetical protein
MRLEWLDTQRATHLGATLRTQPWHQLIRVLHRMGRHASAAQVAIELERHLRRAGLIGAGTPTLLRRLTVGAHDLFGWLAGYGHRPWRALSLAAAVWWACGTIYWTAERSGAAPPAPGGVATGCPCDEPPRSAAVSALRAYAYSLDALVPLLHVQPVGPPVAAPAEWAAELEDWLGAPWLRVLTWLEGLCGWVLAATVLASVSGWARRDRLH